MQNNCTATDNQEPKNTQQAKLHKEHRKLTVTNSRFNHAYYNLLSQLPKNFDY